MESPDRRKQRQEDKAVGLCTDILYLARNELYINMHYLDIALSSFKFVCDSSIITKGNLRGIATDGSYIIYEPDYLMKSYSSGRVLVNRAYLHMLLHCLFLHLYNRRERIELLWDLSCDIAVEYICDSMELRSLRIPPDAVRREFYMRLKSSGIRAMNAESIYEAFCSMQLSENTIRALFKSFTVDNHCFWYDENRDEKTAERNKNEWKEKSEKTMTALETGDKASEEETDALSEQLRIENRERYDYRSFLRKFSVLKEEIRADDDSFDYIFYTYGLSLYKNMPLIEPQETKESFAVEEFVIAVDTSYSTSGELVKKFLEETYDVLSEKESWFLKINVRIIQCDDRILSDVKIESREDMEKYMEDLELLGQGGTDFRPVFSYVEGLINKGEFKKLKGLIYFTDGKGIFPLKKPAYDTAFVFMRDNYEDADVPGWAMKLILEPDDFMKKDIKPGVELKNAIGEAFSQLRDEAKDNT